MNNINNLWLNDGIPDKRRSVQALPLAISNTGRRSPVARGLISIIAGALIILAAIAANGPPTVFTDTDDYYTLGRELVDAAKQRIAPAPPSAEPPSEEEIADAEQIVEDAHMGHTQMASRSALYGVLLYMLARVGTLWAVAAAQALAVSWLLFLLWRVAFAPAPPRGFLVGMFVLAAGSTLPFFAGFAMPDIFAPAAALAVVVIVLYRDRLQRGETWATAAMLAFAMAVHTSHVLFVVPLAAAGAAAVHRLGVVRAEKIARLGIVGAALVIAIVANSLYGLAVKLETGDTLRRQPFLTARVLADGPGRRYLRHACAAGVDYTLCRFKNEPLDDSEDVLWSDLPKTGVFLMSDYATRIKLEDEEPRFVLGTLKYDPLGQAAASLDNWWRQMSEIQVDDPVKDPVFYLTDSYWKDTTLPILVRRVAECGLNGTGCPSRMTAALSRRWHGGVLIASALAIVGAGIALRRRHGPLGEADRRLVALVWLFAAAIVFNAAVCGILSGPFARYQSRMVWLVPAAACLMVAAATRRDIVDEGPETLEA